MNAEQKEDLTHDYRVLHIRCRFHAVVMKRRWEEDSANRRRHPGVTFIGRFRDPRKWWNSPETNTLVIWP